MRGLGIYLVGIGALGALIGLFVGLSDSPVVSGVLTSLFGLLGVAGSFYLPWAQAKSTTADNRVAAAETAREAAVAAADNADAALAKANQATEEARKAAQAAATARDEARAELEALQAAKPAAPKEQLELARLKLADLTSKHEAAEQALAIASSGEAAARNEQDQADKHLARKSRDASAALRGQQAETSTNVGMTYTAAGASLTVFSLAIAVTGLYGMLLRTGSSWDALLPRAPAPHLVEAADGQAAVSAVLLDRLLGGLQVADSERTQIVHLAVTGCRAVAEINPVTTAALLQLEPLKGDATLPVADATRGMGAFQIQLELPVVADNPEQQRNAGRAHAALRQAIAEIGQLWQAPGFAANHAEAAKALAAFQVAAAQYVGCEDVDQVVDGLTARLTALKDSPLVRSVSTIHNGLETVPQ